MKTSAGAQLAEALDEELGKAWWGRPLLSQKKEAVAPTLGRR